MDSINYTIIMDNAPGPDDLRLSLVSNPSISLATTDHTVGTETPITIDVRTTLYFKFD